MRRWNRLVVLVVAVVMGLPSVASAQWQQSTSYGMNESQVGGNGLFNSNSTSYSIKPATDDGGVSVGGPTAGNSSSTSYQTNSGFTTTAQPGLIMTISSGSTNLGLLSASVASTATATFSVRDYTSSGYNVFMIGTAPTYSGHVLSTLPTDTSYTTNTEEFGVNLVSDSTVSGSANATCQAAGFCYGVSGDGSTNHYTQTNKFRFNSGEVVASGAKSSGETDYTMSFLAGINNLTPAGQYQGSISLVATGTY